MWGLFYHVYEELIIDKQRYRLFFDFFSFSPVNIHPINSNSRPNSKYNFDSLQLFQKCLQFGMFLKVLLAVADCSPH
jgi:hypothetical protein